MENEHNIFIGSKPESSYVLALVTQFSQGANSVVVKARGNMISQAVYVVESFRSRFDSKVNLSIKIGSEQLTRNDGRLSNVPFIEITISKEDTQTH